MFKPKREVLWKKQRLFLESCLKANCPTSNILNELHISEKMFLLWLSKPVFRKRYQKVKSFLKEKSELDLQISATSGAHQLAEAQLKKEKPGESLKIVDAARRPAKKAPPSKTRQKARRLSPPGLSDGERERLIESMYLRKAAKAKRLSC